MHEQNSETGPRPTLRIIRPSSREQTDLLPERIVELRKLGFRILHDELAQDPSWAYSAASIPHRTEALTSALTERSSTAIVCARGGYGASDLLPHLPWDKLRTASRDGKLTPKLLVGFSDISALHSALWRQLGWVGLHAPMPATSLWRKDGENKDIEALLECLSGAKFGGDIPVKRVPDGGKNAPEGKQPRIEGRLFGGCFSVLTNLIGTPYLPPDLGGYILFFEDIGEHPGRLMRFLNQWLQAGMLRGVRAVVLGSLTQLAPAIPDNADFVYAEFAKRLECPVFCTSAFGHVSPNFPIGVGVEAWVAGDTLSWKFRTGKNPESTNT